MKAKVQILAALALTSASFGAAYAKTSTHEFKLSEANRPAEDVARDASRKPTEMVKFAMINPGQSSSV